jgi:hypothetical protein
MESRMAFALMVVAVGILVSPAAGSDLSPPAYRGQAGSTVQEWDFMTSGTLVGDPGQGPTSNWYSAPDGFSGITNNPYGTATLSVEGDSRYWVPPGYHNGPGTGGVWYDFSAMYIHVPNQPSAPPENWKALRLQVTFCDPPSQQTPTAPGTQVEAPLPAAPWRDAFTLQTHTIRALATGWYQLIENWSYATNPADEYLAITNPYDPTFSLGQGFGVKEIVIDTICKAGPLADPGGPYRIIDSVILDGAGSFRPDCAIVVHEWDVGADGTVDLVGQQATCSSEFLLGLGYHVGDMGIPITLTVRDEWGMMDMQATTLDLLPDPATLSLLALGSLGLAIRRKRW